MPLSSPTNRALHHTRRVTCEGYKREDGLWDIEGHLTDTKAFDIPLRERGQNGVLPAGEPVHGLSIRITVDLELNILDAEASMDYTPFRMCPGIASVYKKLIGTQIAPGFTKITKNLFSGVNGCTHLLELLGPIATTAFQATHYEREALHDWSSGTQRPPMLDTCHTLSASGPVVEEYWPHFYEAPENRKNSPSDHNQITAICLDEQSV
ncbi:MAG: DUF2889 domain-containing protein [Pontibacterium sp.]